VRRRIVAVVPHGLRLGERWRVRERGMGWHDE
jgi:hypothetical protein